MSISTERMAEPNNSRLAAIRRLYFYLVALISFIVGLAGLDGLLRYLSEAWLADENLRSVYDSQFARETIARSGGALLVATPIFLLHWGYIQRRQAEAGERGSAWRKFFLYAASAVTVGYMLVSGYEGLSGVARLALGESLATSALWPSAWLHHVLIIAVAAALYAYFHAVLIRDGDYGRESGLAASWRRLYQTLAGLASLALLIQGGASILETGLGVLIDLLSGDISTGEDWWRNQLADGIALALLGALVARLNWQRWLRITAGSSDEAKSVLRRIYLYAAVVIGALATLIPAAGSLYEVLLLLFEPESGSWGFFLDRIITPLAYAPLGIIVWVWHWRYLKREAEQYGESSEGATVRRLYYYAVAATGLALLWFGAVSVLQSILDRLLIVDPADGRIWVEPLASGLSLLAVGAPIWSLHWRTVQAIARQADEQGARERASLPRRIYLYGVALVGALLILFYLAQVVYRVLLLLLGDVEAGLFSAATVNDIARCIIAAILWSVHLWAIRGDARLGGEEPIQVSEAGEQARAALLQRIERLEKELAQARSELAAIDKVTG